MKKQVSRHRDLAPFALSLEEMRGVCSSLSEEFDNPDEVSVSIDVKLPGGVRLEFESVEEMMGHPSLPDIIKEYNIRIGGKRIFDRDGKEQSLRIGYSNFLGAKATISARSEKEGWCAGVIETASSVLRKHRVWHHWVPRNFFFWMIVYPLSCFGFLLYFGWSEYKVRFDLLLISLIPAWLMCFASNRILPASAIRVREKEGFLRRYSTEIKVVAGLVSAVALTIALFKNWTFGS